MGPLEALDWRALLKRAFEVDVKICSRCKVKLVARAVITERETALAILAALTSSREPPMAVCGFRVSKFVVLVASAERRNFVENVKTDRNVSTKCGIAPAYRPETPVHRRRLPLDASRISLARKKWNTIAICEDYAN